MAIARGAWTRAWRRRRCSRVCRRQSRVRGTGSQLIEASASSDRRAIVLRPGIVYGTGSQFWIDKLGERILSGAWGTFGAAGEGYAGLVHVDDVADIVASAAKALVAPGRSNLPQLATANVVGPEQPTWNRFFATLATAMGKPALPEFTPSEVAWRQAAASAAKVWRPAWPARRAHLGAGSDAGRNESCSESRRPTRRRPLSD